MINRIEKWLMAQMKAHIMPMKKIRLIVLFIHLLKEFQNFVLCRGRHISILEQEFQRRAINSIPFGVLASEFNVESKNLNRFAGERHDFFGQNSKGVPH